MPSRRAAPIIFICRGCRPRYDNYKEILIYLFYWLFPRHALTQIPQMCWPMFLCRRNVSSCL